MAALNFIFVIHINTYMPISLCLIFNKHNLFACQFVWKKESVLQSIKWIGENRMLGWSSNVMRHVWKLTLSFFLLSCSASTQQVLQCFCIFGFNIATRNALPSVWPRWLTVKLGDDPHSKHTRMQQHTLVQANKYRYSIWHTTEKKHKIINTWMHILHSYKNVCMH